MGILFIFILTQIILMVFCITDMISWSTWIVLLPLSIAFSFLLYFVVKLLFGPKFVADFSKPQSVYTEDELATWLAKAKKDGHDVRNHNKKY